MKSCPRLGRGHCRECDLYIDNPRFRTLVDHGPEALNDVELPAFGQPAAICVHVGEQISGHERERHGLTHLRIWYECTAGRGDPAGFTCLCGGCGPQCEGYAPGPV